MENKNIDKADQRLEKISDLLLKYTLGDYKVRETPSGKGDEIDAIIIGINTLGEELEASGVVVRDYQKRTAAIMDVLLKYTLFDFSEKIKVEGNGDELDAIVIGLNTMAEEIVFAEARQKKYLEEIQKTNHFLDTILENIPNMVFVKDAEELRFVRFNKAGEDLLGFKSKDMIGKNDYDFFPKEQADFFTKKDREALAKTGITDIKEELINTSTGPKWLHTKKIPIRDENGKPVYLLGISEDISERKSSEEKIKNLNKLLQKNVLQLESSNSELEAFTYSVSHDLRAPLRAIHGYTKIISEEYSDKLDLEGKHMMNGVMDNAKKMGQLIDDLLALSRMGKKELVKEEIDLSSILKQGISEVKRSVDTSNVKLSISPLGNACVDPALMLQVFINLFSNAVKYSSLKPAPVIDIGIIQNGAKPTYFIKDNGSGFDMKYYNKLFGVFQRLHDPHEFEGTGVGLALVKRIITRHGGKIWAEAEVNKGATFYFTLDPNQ